MDNAVFSLTPKEELFQDNRGRMRNYPTLKPYWSIAWDGWGMTALWEQEQFNCAYMALSRHMQDFLWPGKPALRTLSWAGETRLFSLLEETATFNGPTDTFEPSTLLILKLIEDLHKKTTIKYKYTSNNLNRKGK